jgi:hypothetical protein
MLWKLNPNFQLVKIKGKHYTEKLGDSAHLCCSLRKKNIEKLMGNIPLEAWTKWGEEKKK